MKKIFLLFTISLFAGTGNAAESIALNNLIAAGISNDEAASLSNALRSELGKAGKYQVMERGQMEEILKEQGFQKTGACDETSCAVEIGRLLAVKYIVLGNVGIVGRTYTLNVRIVDVETGKIISDINENHKGTLDALLTEKIPLVARKLCGLQEEKKPKAGIWVAAGTGAAAAIAIPLIILSRKDYSEEKATDITVRWNQ